MYRLRLRRIPVSGVPANVKDLDVTTPTGTTLFANTAVPLHSAGGLHRLRPRDSRSASDHSGRGQERPRGLERRPRCVGPRRLLHHRCRCLRAGVSCDYSVATRAPTASQPGRCHLPRPSAPSPTMTDVYSASYSMEEVDNIATYYLYTGDLAFVRTEWPMISRELGYDQSLVDSRGLLATDTSNGMDWDYYDGAKSGEVTAYNDIYYETLKDASGLADALGMHAQAAIFSQKSELASIGDQPVPVRPQGGAVRRFESQAHRDRPGRQLPGRGLRRCSGGTGREQSCELCTRLFRRASLGLCPTAPTPGIELHVSPYVTDQEVQASFAAGDTGPALSILQTTWGHMIAPGPDFTGADWELVGAKGDPGFGSFTSLAHGWASGATADLSAYVLGVQPSSAGYRTWLVQPHPGSLAWVEGDVPTPNGNDRRALGAGPANRPLRAAGERPERDQRDDFGAGAQVGCGRHRWE